MKITKISPFLVDRFLLVRVYTDEGIIGNGEAGLWVHHKTVYAAIEELSDYYIGQDPARIEHHYQVVSRNTHFMGAVLSAAMSALDIAMWDILGKAANLPVSVDPNLAFLAIFSRDCRDFGVIYSDFGYRKQPISYLKIAQI
ncbi:hypothetical protein KFU94_17270 [Chloroflexi bacterium TSY]|nr:hypothetical protein [Chloroflexi bacterium TSY]